MLYVIWLDNNYIRVRWWDVITLPCPNFIDALVKWGTGQWRHHRNAMQYISHAKYELCVSRELLGDNRPQYIGSALYMEHQWLCEIDTFFIGLHLIPHTIQHATWLHSIHVFPFGFCETLNAFVWWYIRNFGFDSNMHYIKTNPCTAVLRNRQKTVEWYILSLCEDSPIASVASELKCNISPFNFNKVLPIIPCFTGNI